MRTDDIITALEHRNQTGRAVQGARVHSYDGRRCSLHRCVLRNIPANLLSNTIKHFKPNTVSGGKASDDDVSLFIDWIKAE